jgi:ribosome-associated heat shock protein Hsp15
LSEERPEEARARRLDTWLDVACLFKTRAEAQRACRAGKVDVNGLTARPHRLLKADDEVRITRGPGRRQVVRVQGFAERHIARPEARRLYEDRTPPPSPEERERLRREREWRREQALPRPAPHRRDRRALRRLRGKA